MKFGMHVQNIQNIFSKKKKEKKKKKKKEKKKRKKRTYRTCNPTVEYSKYTFINKLLGSVTLLRVTSGIT